MIGPPVVQMWQRPSGKRQSGTFLFGRALDSHSSLSYVALEVWILEGSQGKNLNKQVNKTMPFETLSPQIDQKEALVLTRCLRINGH